MLRSAADDRGLYETAHHSNRPQPPLLHNSQTLKDFFVDLECEAVEDAKANGLRCQTRRFPELWIIHFRKPKVCLQPYGMKNLAEAGYYWGYHPLLMVLGAVKR